MQLSVPWETKNAALVYLRFLSTIVNFETCDEYFISVVCNLRGMSPNQSAWLFESRVKDQSMKYCNIKFRALRVFICYIWLIDEDEKARETENSFLQQSEAHKLDTF